MAGDITPPPAQDKVPTLPDRPEGKYRGELQPEEYFWRDHQRWLQEQGYMLRSRYSPDWVPSWKEKHKPFWQCDDGQAIMVPHLLDATRASDGSLVVLKRILVSEHPYEVEISQFFSSEPLVSDPHNHCISIYDVLHVPDEDGMVILVMPLMRRYDSPPLQTVGETTELFRQIFEGLQFMHQHHVAHRDCMNLNIMMDPRPLFPEMYHPRLIDWSRDLTHPAKHHTRTARPTKYYFIDFGLSRRYDPASGPPREVPIHGGDRSVPEFRNSNEPVDPFPTDVYYVGNLIREDFLQKYHGVEFMQPLVDDMVQDEPTKRPTADEVVARFGTIQSSLNSRKLRSRLVEINESPVRHIVNGVKHAFDTLGNIATSHSPIPRP
ncbi:uncharacterized protein FIBRA_06048 [Fibroporia radiculosa]|uniref:Protein kinase domain-containing protein n=1 Tax=Fibroporia radiculosa TaxID=599839 RepID=J4HYI5_9APHY|nr:uncharacterized protein FIBRA_06048 [Fibroporia radiculosa]CCM03897.1 predicted protein [Fibroporia radiculosa]